MANRNITYIASLFALTGILTISCTRVEQGSDDVRSSVQISLASPVLEKVTKGQDPLTDSKLQNFGISAILNYDGVGENQFYLSNQAVVKGVGTSPWTINPTAYWPLFGDLSFFFYAPYYESHPEIHFIETETGLPKIEFTPSATDIKNQMDFCIGRSLMHKTKEDNPLPVQFEHCLSQIWFCVNYIGVVPDGFYVLITEIKIKNVVGTKSLTYSNTDPYYVWEDESSHTADSVYVLERNKSHIKQDTLRISTGTVTDTLTNRDGVLYLLPQTLGPEAKLEVNYGLFHGANIVQPADTIALFQKEIALPTDKPWPAGKTVFYKLTLDVGISSPLKLDCSIEDWLTSGNTHPQYEFE